MTSGAVAVLLSEDVPVTPVVSQGCRPIGQPFTVTNAQQNLVLELAGQPAMQRLQELVMAADEDERDLMRQGLHLGVVVDEHKLDFSRGDFLVRNVLGADRNNGAIAVGELVQVGQTVQFHVRDLAESLMGLGHDVSVLAPADDDTPVPDYLTAVGGAIPCATTARSRASRSAPGRSAGCGAGWTPAASTCCTCTSPSTRRCR